MTMKNSLKKVRAAAACAALSSLLLAGCGPGPGPEAELVGVYAVRKEGDGTLRELVKIERQGGRYVLRDKVRTPDWSAPKMQLQPVTREGWRRITTDSGDTPFVGVSSEQLAVFKVPPGWEKNGFRTGTGYFLVYSRGPVEAHKL
ncbi:hypothetical protein M2165_003946 [Variovorax sp. TBS-050B]|jgi:hypothetical protein|uniref:hypothetical protein n=1 Tax=Variovorax sp. TBS-050B TaxID=2940551 RepID=UPI0024771DD5|nr:hypothetical protein [Variovorax sp. TBS-050B]MDH6594057.1 hypothetical protein [Variovorax sp. TBS-050B]